MANHIEKGGSVHCFLPERAKTTKRKIIDFISIAGVDFYILNKSTHIPCGMLVAKKDGEFTPVQDLSEGDELFYKDGDFLIVDSVEQAKKSDDISFEYPVVRGDLPIFYNDVLIKLYSKKEEQSFNYYGSPGCLLAGTLISMADGSKKVVEAIEIGDEVKSFNEHTKKVENQKVLGVDSPVCDEYAEVITRDCVICLTSDHPLYARKHTGAKKWCAVDYIKCKSLHPYLDKVSSLEKGDYVLSDLDNIWQEVIHIKTIKDQVTTHNLWCVERNRNYYANGLLVHNKGSIHHSSQINIDSKSKKSISDLCNNEFVASYNNKTGELSRKKIRGITQVNDAEYFDIQVATDKSIRISEDQLVFGRRVSERFPKEGWFSISGELSAKHHPYISDVRKLDLECELYHIDRKWVRIVSIQKADGIENGYVVWDVEDNLSYFVDSFLVHNATS